MEQEQRADGSLLQNSMMAMLLATGMALSPLEAFVGPVHAEALSAEQLQERKDTMKAKRLVQVQAEREARGSTDDAPPSSLQELMRSIPTAPIVKGGEVVPDMLEKPKVEMPSFRSLLESAPMVELSNVEMPAIKSPMESASETPNSEFAVEQKATVDRAAERRAAAEERARDMEREEREKAGRYEAARKIKEELAAEQRSTQLAATVKKTGNTKQQVAKAPKNFAKKEKTESGPGFVAFTLGRVFGAAYVTAVLVAVSAYLTKGSVAVEEVLANVSEDFNKIENKPVTVAYVVGGLIAFSAVDFFFNLPILNLLFPSMFQALGAAAAFKLAFTYKKDGGDPVTDMKTFFSKVSNELPGLKK